MLDAVEHVLLRPETYLGSVKLQTARGGSGATGMSGKAHVMPNPSCLIFPPEAKGLPGAAPAVALYTTFQEAKVFFAPPADAPLQSPAADPRDPGLLSNAALFDFMKWARSLPGLCEQNWAIPGMYKCMDELITNAADNAERSPPCTRIDVSVDFASSSFEVFNDGRCIPLRRHGNLPGAPYLPTLAFGRLNSSSNFDDSERRFVGGRNGLGASLANIFSERTEVEIRGGPLGKQRRRPAAASAGVLFSQAWANNMKEENAPSVSRPAGLSPQALRAAWTGTTRVRTWPDIEYFRKQNSSVLSKWELPGEGGAAALDRLRQKIFLDTALACVHRLACVAATSGVRVTINGNRIRQPHARGSSSPRPSGMEWLAASMVEPVQPTGEPELVGSGLARTEPTGQLLVHGVARAGWEVAVVVNPGGGSPEGRAAYAASLAAGALGRHARGSVSFVNNVATLQGGEHVIRVVQQVVQHVNRLCGLAAKRAGGQVHAVTAHVLAGVCTLFVACRVANPQFRSQSKDFLVSKPGEWIGKGSVKAGGVLALTKAELKKLCDSSGLVEAVKALHLRKSSREDRRISGKKVTCLTGIPKLQDAHRAGGRTSHKCTLILTEGESAKSLAVAGMSVVGRGEFGVYSLRGKLINAGKATTQALMANQEVKDLVRILGLQVNAEYDTEESVRKLRYGRIMIMADQDVDGFHIKGLVLHLFRVLWPGLFRRPGFLVQFRTPLLRCTLSRALPYSEVEETLARAEAQESGGMALGWRKIFSNCFGARSAPGGRRGGSKRTKRTKSQSQADPAGGQLLAKVDLFSAAEMGLLVGFLETFAQSAPRITSVKYYKGLGTSTNQDARAYFGNMARHLVDFTLPQDGRLLGMFYGKKVSERKAWIRNLVSGPSAEAATDNPLPQAGQVADQEGGATGGLRVSVEDFVTRELGDFAVDSCRRAIPSAMDGLKPGQRKVLWLTRRKFPHVSGAASAKEVKVSQLMGIVSEQTNYHHGEASLMETIRRMAQDIVGKNNLPFLIGEGQFGTRSQGGEDAASARYIFVRLNPVVAALFPPEDDALAPRTLVDGDLCEPEELFPVVPTCLLNGGRGIACGFATDVPSFAMETLVRASRAFVEDWAVGFLREESLREKPGSLARTFLAGTDPGAGPALALGLVAAWTTSAANQEHGALTSALANLVQGSSDELDRRLLAQGPAAGAQGLAASLSDFFSSPQHRGFAGEVLPTRDLPRREAGRGGGGTARAYFTRGCMRWVDDPTPPARAHKAGTQKRPLGATPFPGSGGYLHITELPVGTWTNKYCSFLEGLVERKEKTMVTSFTQHHTTYTVDFRVRVAGDSLQAFLSHHRGINDEGPASSLASVGHRLFQLERQHRVQLNLFAPIPEQDWTWLRRLGDGSQHPARPAAKPRLPVLREYRCEGQVCLDFYKKRLKVYMARKAVLLERSVQDLVFLATKYIFVQGVVLQAISLKETTGKELERKSALYVGRAWARLRGDGAQGALARIQSGECLASPVGSAPQAENFTSGNPHLPRLMALPIASFTEEKVVSLREKLVAQMEGVASRVLSVSPAEMWIADLHRLSSAYEEERKRFNTERSEDSKKK